MSPASEGPALRFPCAGCRSVMVVPLSGAGADHACPECGATQFVPEIVGLDAAEAARPAGQRNLAVRRPAGGVGGSSKPARAEPPRLPKPGEAPQAAGAASGPPSTVTPPPPKPTMPMPAAEPEHPAIAIFAAAAAEAGAAPAAPGPMPTPHRASFPAAAPVLPVALPALPRPQPVVAQTLVPQLPTVTPVAQLVPPPLPSAPPHLGRVTQVSEDHPVRRAVTAIVAGIIACVSFIFVSRTLREQAAEEIRETLGTTDFLPPPAAVAAPADKLPPNAPMTFDDFNFRWRPPGSAWVEVPDPWRREGVLVSYHRRAAGTNKPEASFTLRVLPLSSEAASDRNRALLAADAGLSLLGEHAAVRRREDVSTLGLLFTRAELDNVRMGRRPVNMELWHYLCGGVLYELSASLPGRTPPAYLAEVLREVGAGFSIIDPGRRLNSAEVLAALEDFGARPVESPPGSGEVITFTQPLTSWKTWPGGSSILPGTESALASRNGYRVACAFAPAEGLPADDASLLEALPAAWPALQRFAWNPAEPVNHQGLDATRRIGTGTLLGRSGTAELRFVRRGPSLMALFAFGPTGVKPDAVASLLDAFAVRSDAKAPPPSVGFGEAAERESRRFHRALLTGLAENASAHGRHEEASRHHMALYEWDRLPDDLCNAARCLAAMAPRNPEVLSLIEDHEGSLADDPDWQRQKLLLLAETSHAEASRVVAATLLRGSGMDGSLAAAYVETLIQQEAWDAATGFLKILAGLDTSPAWHLYNAIVLAGSGQRRQAAAIVRAIRTADPDNLELHTQCVDVLMRCGLHPEALELARFLARTNPQNETILQLVAVCHEAQGQTAEARDAWRRVADLNPASTTARAALASLAASSGQAATSEFIVADLPPVPLPPRLAATLAKTRSTATDPDAAGALHLYRVTGLQAMPGRPLRQTVRGAIRILDEEGMQAFNTMRIAVHPLGQQLAIHHLRVIDPAGGAPVEASIDAHYALDDAADGLATSGKVIHLPVPGLKPGAVIEYAWTIENTGAAESLDYTRHVFALTESCRADIWYITGDLPKLRFASSRGLKPDKDGDALVWTENHPVLLSPARHRDGSAEDLPVLHAGVPSASWERLGREYLDRIRDRLRQDPVVAAAAAEATRGLTEPAARIRALAALVRDRVSYTAIEFGARAVIPNAPAATLTNRYGDCKDHSVLLQQLLRANGIHACLCLISSRGPIQEDFPCMAQFDHMIVAVPGPRSSWDFIDPTNKYLDPVPGTAPIGLEGRLALVLHPESPALVRTPGESPPTTATTAREVTLKGERDALVRETIALSGSRAAAVRTLIAPLAPQDRPAVLRRLFGFDRASHQVSDLKIRSIKDLDKPLEIEITWEARNSVRRAAEGWRLDLPAVVESSLMLPPGLVGADAGPLHLAAPVHVTSATILHLPIGHMPAPESLQKRQASSSFGSWTLAAGVDNAARTLEVSWECRLHAGTIPPAQVRAFQDFAHDSLRPLAGDWLLLGDSPRP